MVMVIQRDTGVTSHTMSKVDTEPHPHPTGIAVRAMENRTRPVIVKVANLAVVFGKRFSLRFTARIDAPIIGRLQGIALHAHDFCNGISIQWLVLVF